MKTQTIYSENKGLYGWNVWKNELGEVKAYKQCEGFSSVSTPWYSDVNKVRKSLPNKIRKIIIDELEK